MSLEITTTGMPGCLLISPQIQRDERGSFVKTFVEEEFIRHGLPTSWAEEYHSLSRPGVLRGLHFQRPPHDHDKMVTCVTGSVFDVVVDLRRGSPTFGEHACFELSAENAKMLFVPSGLAHGFCVPEVESVLLYKTSTAYAPQYDDGLRWDSLDIPWPLIDPVLSERDQGFPAFAALESPFRRLQEG